MFTKLQLFRRHLRPGKNPFQSPHRAVDISLTQNVWGQESKYGFMRAVEEQAFLHAVEHQLLAWEFEFNTDHQPLPPPFPDEREPPHQVGEAHTKIPTHGVDRRQ